MPKKGIDAYEPLLTLNTHHVMRSVIFDGVLKSEHRVLPFFENMPFVC